MGLQFKGLALPWVAAVAAAALSCSHSPGPVAWKQATPGCAKHQTGLFVGLDAPEGWMAKGHAEAYSDMLGRACEPRLSDVNAPEVYRLLWSRSFRSDVVLRVERVDGVWRLRVREQWEGVRPQRRSRDVDRLLTPTEAASFTTKLQAGFWNMEPHDGRIGADGDSWTMEGMRDGQYGWMERWEPTSRFRSKPYVELYAALLELAGFHVAMSERAEQGAALEGRYTEVTWQGANVWCGRHEQLEAGHCYARCFADVDCPAGFGCVCVDPLRCFTAKPCGQEGCAPEGTCQVRDRVPDAG